jgi:hypothetical protein
MVTTIELIKLGNKSKYACLSSNDLTIWSKENEGRQIHIKCNFCKKAFKLAVKVSPDKLVKNIRFYNINRDLITTGLLEFLCQEISHHYLSDAIATLSQFEFEDRYLNSITKTITNQLNHVLTQ